MALKDVKYNFSEKRQSLTALPNDNFFVDFLVSVQHEGIIGSGEYSQPRVIVHLTPQGLQIKFCAESHMIGTTHASLIYTTNNPGLMGKLVLAFFSDKKAFGELAKQLVQEGKMIVFPQSLYSRCGHDETVDIVVKGWINAKPSSIESIYFACDLGY